jgi:hypothetical protein
MNSPEPAREEERRLPANVFIDRINKLNEHNPQAGRSSNKPKRARRKGFVLGLPDSRVDTFVDINLSS